MRLVRLIASSAIISYGIFLLASPKQLERLLDAAFDDDFASANGERARRKGGEDAEELSETGVARNRLLQSFNGLAAEGEGGDSNNTRGKDICSVLPQPTPTALSLWSHHLPHIFNATQHPSDHNPEFIFRDFTALLLHFLSPDRLQRSVKTLPLDWTPVERSLDIVYQRAVSLRKAVDAYRGKHRLSPHEPIPPKVMSSINNDKSHPRKLNIVVMGGSVTMGVVCNINPTTTQTKRYTRRACAWPGRLAPFFSQLFGGYELVEFHTLALGGTNTASGITMWDYSLLPGDTPFPDVLINSYATNDMHYNSVQEAMAQNKTLGQSLLELSQSFVRQVLTPKLKCGHRPPLLLYIDDYLGNEQSEVLATMTSTQTIHLISGYYGIGSISYGDAVRDLVYGDTTEWWFSSRWFEGGKYVRAVHPHMGMHISMVWVVAFNLINLITTYCSLPKLDKQLPTNQMHNRYHAGVESNSKGVFDYGYRSINGLPMLQATKELEGGPKAKPRGIPPPLTGDLSLEHITQKWNKDSESNSHLWNTLKECIDQGQVLSDESPSLPKPCIYSWVSNLERSLDNPKRITDKLKPHITTNKGWSAADDNNKLGWVPSGGLGSTFTMEWKKISQPVRAVTWMIMRSYGEKWKGSMLKVEVWSGGALMVSEDIVGFHDKHTSETYNIKMKLSGGVDDNEKQAKNGAAVGSDLKIKFTLIAGTTFKISGMAICDH